MNLHLPYSVPTRTDICVAFCFFNPCGYIRPVQNLAFIEQKLRFANIPYYSIEMVIGDNHPILANPTLRLRSKSSLFYKEALWNRLEKEIPSQYTKIAFIDSDIVFSDPNWLDKLSVLLDSCDLVHPFQTVDRLNLSYEKVDTLTSSVIDGNVVGSGMGWAITREAFHALGGFFDKGILGNGDTLFYQCINSTLDIKNDQYSLIRDLFLNYRTQFHSVNPKITYLNTHIYHLSHGTIKNRQYGSRHNDILSHIKESWDALFSLNSDGFWELIDDTLNERMINYFVSRKEDSEDRDYVKSIKYPLPITKSPIMNIVRPILMKTVNTPKEIQKVIPPTPGKVYVAPVKPRPPPVPKPLASLVRPIPRLLPLKRV